MTEHEAPRSGEATTPAPNDPGAEQERLRREIEQTRSELGETVEALSHKADVKAQARQRAEQAKTEVREMVEHAKTEVRQQVDQRPAVPVAVGVGVALVALWLIRRR